MYLVRDSRNRLSYIFGMPRASALPASGLELTALFRGSDEMATAAHTYLEDLPSLKKSGIVRLDLRQVGQDAVQMNPHCIGGGVRVLPVDRHNDLFVLADQIAH